MSFFTLKSRITVDMCVLDGKLYPLLRSGLFDFKVFHLICPAIRHFILIGCWRVLHLSPSSVAVHYIEVQKYLKDKHTVKRYSMVLHFSCRNVNVMCYFVVRTGNETEIDLRIEIIILGDEKS